MCKRTCSRMSSILVICVKMSTRWPPRCSRRSNTSNSCSLPQSNCTRRRSGKKSVRRIITVCSSAARAPRSAATTLHAARLAAATTLGGGCEHHACNAVEGE